MTEPKRQLAAIMFTDIVGYTALMGGDESKTMELVRLNLEIQKTAVKNNHGTWLKEMGDGTLSSFQSASDAVNCSLQIMDQITPIPELQLRIGIHIGDMMIESNDVYGDGINVASRIQTAAEPGQIVVSDSVHRNVRNKEGINSDFIKEATLKNVDEPIKIYNITSNTEYDIYPNPQKSIHWKKRLGIAIAIMIIAFLGYSYSEWSTLFQSTSIGDESTEFIEKSIAVLAFDDQSPDSDQEWLGDGIADAILNALAHIRGMQVTGKTSSFSFKGKNVTIKEIGKALNVRTILEGSVSKVGDKLRINAQLIDVETDRNLWSQSYDRKLDDVFAIQSEIAKSVALELSTVLSPKEIEQFEKRGTENVEAYNLYLLGRHFWHKRTEQDLRKSVNYFHQALSLDTDYALAHAGLADAYLIQVEWGWLSRSEGYPKTKEQALKALEIEPNLAEAHATLGILATVEWQWSNAETELNKAIELNPNYATGRQYYSEYLDVTRQPDKAREQINRALKLNPLSIILHIISSSYYFNEGKLNESLAAVMKAMDLDRNRTELYWKLFHIYREQGKDEDALKQLEIIWLMDSTNTKYIKDINYVYANSEIDGVLRWWTELDEYKSTPIYMAYHYAVLGEKELALDWIEKAFELGQPGMATINNTIWFENLRSEPRFIALLKEMGLEN
jgi:TolB-like protein/class 3 adenylate cyclase